MSETITIDQYTSLVVEEYKGTYSITEGWIDKEGEFKMNWCEREFGKEKVKKRCPVKVKCGSRETLLNLANYILAQYGYNEDYRTKEDKDIEF